MSDELTEPRDWADLTDAEIDELLIKVIDSLPPDWCKDSLPADEAFADEWDEA